MEDIIALRDEMVKVDTVEKMKIVINKLEKQFVSLEVLEDTKIGIVLRKMIRRVRDTDSENVNDVVPQANAILRKWKNTAKVAMDRRKRRLAMFGKS